MQNNLLTLRDEFLSEAIDRIRFREDFADESDIESLFLENAHDYVGGLGFSGLCELLDVDLEEFFDVCREIGDSKLIETLRNNGLSGVIEAVVLHLMMEGICFDEEASEIITVKQFMEDVEFEIECALEGDELVISPEDIKKLASGFCRTVIYEHDSRYQETFELHEKFILNKLVEQISNR